MNRRVVLLFLLFASSCHHAAEKEQATPIAVHCAAPTREDVQVKTTVRGRIAAPPGADLPVASQVPGRVASVSVREGQHVGANEIIAVIDNPTSGPTARSAVANVDQAKAAVANADATLQRTKELVARGYAAKQELDDAQARSDQAHAALASANAGSDLASRTLDRVTVRTSFEGVVTKVLRGPGAIVDGTSNTPIVQVAATHAVELHADATDRQLVGIKEGQGAEIRLAIGTTLRGTVRTTPADVDPKSGLGTVRIAIAEGSVQPLLGAFARATIDLEKREKVLVVPVEAIRGAALDGSEIVICRPDNTAEVKVVTIGWRDDKRVEIVEGLSETDRIAIDHVLALENDTPLMVTVTVTAKAEP